MHLKPFVLHSNIVFGDHAKDPAAFLRDVDGNTGNSYVYYGMSKSIFGKLVECPGIANMWTTDLDTFDMEAINNGGFTHVFLLFKDHIRESFFAFPWIKIERFIQKLRVPLVIFGLGANSLGGNSRSLHRHIPPEMLSCLRHLGDATVSISVRGEYTAGLLAKLGIKNVEITGCPSYFECGPDRLVMKLPWNPSSSIMATGLFSNDLLHKKLYYVLQDESVFLKIMLRGAGAEEDELKAMATNPYEGYAVHVLEAFLDGRVSLFADIEEWKAYARKSRFNLAIGTRVHGAILALNCGIPAVITSGDARAAEMCALFGIPHMPGICGKEMSMERLYDKLDYSALNARYNMLYKRYVAWLLKNGVALQASLQATPPAHAPLTLISRDQQLEQAARLMHGLLKIRGSVFH